MSRRSRHVASFRRRRKWLGWMFVGVGVSITTCLGGFPLSMLLADALSVPMTIVLGIEVIVAWTFRITVVAVPVLFVLIVWQSVVLRRMNRRIEAADFAICTNCGYALGGVADGAKCPECGEVVDVRATRATWREVVGLGHIRDQTREG